MKDASSFYPFTLRPLSFTLHPLPFTFYPSSVTLCPSPFTLYRSPSTLIGDSVFIGPNPESRILTLAFIVLNTPGC